MKPEPKVIEEMEKMQNLLGFMMYILPLVFGLGFLAPVISAGMNALGMTPPLGLSTIVFGLIIGGLWGLFATVKGRWI